METALRNQIFIVALISVFVLGACKKSDDEAVYSVDATTEFAQQVGDAMVSVDESGGTVNGTITLKDSMKFENTYARLFREPQTGSSWALFFISEARAESCQTATFGTCAGGQRVRDFAGCTLGGGGSINGKVTLNFAGSGVGSCAIPTAADAVSRVPQYVITGLRGASFTVSAIAGGQTLTRTGSNAFTFANAGIRRTFTTPKGNLILDVTTSTTSPLTITGDNRNLRTISGGGMSVTDNLNSTNCTLTPNSIAWSAGCSCPTAGTWSGSCNDATTLSVTFGSTCGTTTVTKGTQSRTVTMDRCQ